jgi:hypothetical protein
MDAEVGPDSMEEMFSKKNVKMFDNRKHSDILSWFLPSLIYDLKPIREVLQIKM